MAGYRAVDPSYTPHPIAGLASSAEGERLALYFDRLSGECDRPATIAATRADIEAAKERVGTWLYDAKNPPANVSFGELRKMTVAPVYLFDSLCCLGYAVDLIDRNIDRYQYMDDATSDTVDNGASDM